MDVVIAVLGSSEAEVREWLDRVCTLGLVPQGGLVTAHGIGGWMLRAVPDTGQRGQRQPGDPVEDH